MAGRSAGVAPTRCRRAARLDLDSQCILELVEEELLRVAGVGLIAALDACGCRQPRSVTESRLHSVTRLASNRFVDVGHESSGGLRAQQFQLILVTVSEPLEPGASPNEGAIAAGYR
jgi:hypothetical protein